MRAARRAGHTAIGSEDKSGAIAQLGEHLLCKQGVGGSIPPGSTSGITLQFRGQKRVS